LLHRAWLAPAEAQRRTRSPQTASCGYPARRFRRRAPRAGDWPHHPLRKLRPTRARRASPAASTRLRQADGIAVTRPGSIEDAAIQDW